MPEAPVPYHSSRPPIRTQADAVIYFIEQLDIEMLNDILDDHITYQDMPKQTFLQKLEVAFDEFKNAGNDTLIRHEGVCGKSGCVPGCSGYSFVGNISGHYFDLIIDIKEGEVKDIYECMMFYSKRTWEFKKMQVVIDRLRNIPKERKKRDQG